MREAQNFCKGQVQCSVNSSNLRNVWFDMEVLGRLLRVTNQIKTESHYYKKQKKTGSICTRV